MNYEPQVKELSHRHRKIFFWILLVLFLVTLPLMIFYTSGYRLNLDNTEDPIIKTGGIYLTTDNLQIEVFLDGKQIKKPRLFRSAYYIQNIETGLHHVVVQHKELNTWVKDLPVNPQMVTEVTSFNMPKVPHLRPVTEYVTATGTPVYSIVASTTEIFTKATTTEPVLFVKNLAFGKFKKYQKNKEYEYVESLFASSSTSSRLILNQPTVSPTRFRFAATDNKTAKEEKNIIKEAVERGGMRLLPVQNELYAVWKGPVEDIPYYFCVLGGEASTTAKLYGKHVAKQIQELSESTTTPLIAYGNQICRPEIKLDHLRQNIHYYDFFPGQADLVLLQLDDGVYVTEIDDRSWQNVQLLYPGKSKNVRVMVDKGRIYLKDGNYYFEIITNLETL